MSTCDSSGFHSSCLPRLDFWGHSSSVFLGMPLPSSPTSPLFDGEWALGGMYMSYKDQEREAGQLDFPPLGHATSIF